MLSILENVAVLVAVIGGISALAFLVGFLSATLHRGEEKDEDARE